MKQHQSTSRWSTRTRTIALIAIFSCWMSCSRFQLRQGWDDQLGPVVPHDTFPADCTMCHTGTDWNTLREDFVFDHERETGVPLVGAHQGAQCLLCHNDRGPVTQFAGKGCAGCHVDVHLGHLGPSCDRCHTEDTWKPTDVIAKHNRTRFPLIGAHVALECYMCHEGAESGVFLPLDTNCVSCHADDFNRTQDPDHQSVGFGTNCQDCHSPIAWEGALSFSHPASFPLSASHGGLRCNDCHSGNGFGGLSTDCASCHMSEFQSTTSPNHMSAGFPTNCEQCHNTGGWVGADFIHTSSFPLSQGHGGLDCFDCHIGNVFTGLSADCVSCHLADFQGTSDPNHVTTGFSMDCELCHTTQKWQGAQFDHPSTFQLTAGHSGLDCGECHIGGTNLGLSTECSSCHMDDFNATMNPSHGPAGFSMNCEECHTTSGWTGVNFNHTPAFPLTAGHGGLDCSDCHLGDVFNGLSSDCVTCHLSDFTGTTNPNHATSGFSMDCELCHTTQKWQGAQFDHPANFPLTAGHGGLNCMDCHVGEVFSGLSTACVSCHTSDFNGTSDPKHSSAGFSSTCQNCHNTSTWDMANFTHTNAFPLAGGHAGHNCNECHSSNVYTGLPSDCVSCHMSDFTGTTNPDHQANGFTTDCKQCHFSTSTWQGAVFNHPANFPLTAGHGGLNCTDCHLGGVFTGLSTACASCHASDFNGTSDPKHSSAGFSSTCQNCHNTSTWDMATFTHTNAFPLSGGHAGHNCNECHSSNVYIGLPSDCVSCHLSDFQGTTNPDHEVNGFSTDCKQCHFSTSTWQGAVFNHSFPITNGKHSNLNCSDCHIVPGNSMIFSCIDCHEHRKTKMDDKHSDVGGYVWASPACLNCHPDGRD